MIIPGKSYKGRLPPLSESEIISARRMRSDVLILAETIGERNTSRYPALIAAEKFIAESFTSLGYEPKKESYKVNGFQVSNIIAELQGQSAGKIIVIGAHYDSAPGTPGANDNASAVAGLLELARMLKTSNPKQTIRFVAFVNEEPPYFFTELMGSRIHAAAAQKRNEMIVAMLCLECLGVYSDTPNSQLYPAPLGRFFPDTANFITFISNIPSYYLLRKCVKEFRKTTPFPSEAIAAPEMIKGVGWSDHWSFWKEGYPAVMITDTAFFRYSHYHTPADTPEKLDYERMARVIGGVRKIIEGLMR